MEYNRKLIGARLRQMRLDLSFTQGFVADAMNVKQASISNIESGQAASIDLFFDLLTFYSKTYRVSNIFMPEFKLMSNETLYLNDSIRAQIISTCQNLKEKVRNDLEDIEALAGVSLVGNRTIGQES